MQDYKRIPVRTDCPRVRRRRFAVVARLVSCVGDVAE